MSKVEDLQELAINFQSIVEHLPEGSEHRANIEYARSTALALVDMHRIRNGDRLQLAGFQHLNEWIDRETKNLIGDSADDEVMDEPTARKILRNHYPTGPYLPIGHLDGDCKQGCGSWPCSQAHKALERIGYAKS